MKNFFVACIFLLLFYFFHPVPSFASSNFATDYNVKYAIQSDTITHVDFDISLTNKTSQYYASSYTIQVGFKDIKNLKASDPDGIITPNIIKDSKGVRSIEVVFNKKVVGVDNKLNFNMSFDTLDVAQKLGNNWEINIPGINLENDFQSFNVNVEVPSFLGNPAYLKPDISTINGNKFSFTKEELGKSGISIAYGNIRFYKFNLTYHLQNKNLFPVLTEIALPPTTNYQDIQIDAIDPKPIDVIRDEDGNWLAKYTLLPSQKFDVTVEGKVKINLYPQKEIISDDKLRMYLVEQPYWQISNEKIKDLANILRTPYAIYEYTVRNLEYDFSRVTEKKERLGALKVLENKNSAVCLEFTDLFVTLARAAGIPAREVNGFAYTQNDIERPLSLVNDVLHAWPEYYDKQRKTWIMVDPTWGNTTGGVDYFHTLDLDHFAFVIKGLNSKYPVPAGGYKLDAPQTSKDVKVSFTEQYQEEKQTVKIVPSFAKSYMSGASIKGGIVIENVGKNLADPNDITVSTKFLNPKLQKINIKKIPPYGKITIPIEFYKTSLLTNITDEATITLADKEISENIKVSPLYINKILLIGGIISAIGIIAVSIFAIKSWNIPILRRKK